MFDYLTGGIDYLYRFQKKMTVLCLVCNLLLSIDYFSQDKHEPVERLDRIFKDNPALLQNVVCVKHSNVETMGANLY